MFYLGCDPSPSVKSSRAFYSTSVNPFTHIKNFVTSHTSHHNIGKSFGKSQSLTDEQINQELNKDHRRPCSLSVDLPSTITTTFIDTEDENDKIEALERNVMGQSHCFVSLPHHSANNIDELSEGPQNQPSFQHVTAGARRARHNSEGSSPIEPRPVLKRSSVGRLSTGTKTKKKQVTIEERATVLFLPNNGNADSKSLDIASDINANEEAIADSLPDGANKITESSSSKVQIDVKSDLEIVKDNDNNINATSNSVSSGDTVSRPSVSPDGADGTIKDKDRKGDEKKSPDSSDSSSEGRYSLHIIRKPLISNLVNHTYYYSIE